MSNDDWLGALGLATMWMFEEVRVFINVHFASSVVIILLMICLQIRQKAIATLDTWVTQTQSAKEAALTAKQYRVLPWLKSSYLRLLRQNTLTIEELSSHPGLDWETIARLFYIAKEVQGSQRNHGYYCLICGNPVAAQKICDTCRMNLFETIFRTEFESMNTMQNHPCLCYYIIL